MLGGSGREHTPLGLSGSTISFPGRSRLVPGEAGLTAYAQLVLYGCMGGGLASSDTPLGAPGCVLCLGCPPGCLSHDPVCLLCSVGMGRGKRVLWIEMYRPSTWARRQRDSDRRQRDSEAPGVQLTDLSDARRRAA